MKIKNLNKIIPNYVIHVARSLNKEGFAAFLTGGAVRDITMNRVPKDYDIATNAKPDEIQSIFPKSIATGARFGAMIVVVKDEFGESHQVDVITFRVEEQYIGGRWPSKVTFADKLDLDLSRRDFTFNAMAINLEDVWKNSANECEVEVIDPFGGIKDIEKKIVRAVGNPLERLKEDALRALRACRFASVLEFEIEKNLFNSISEVLPIIDNLSAERIRDEFVKILENSRKPSIGLRLMKESGIMKIWIPELLLGVGVDQKPFHKDDVFDHLLRTVDLAPKEVRLAALLHDIGKPEKKDGSHFYGHEIHGAQIAEKILKRLKFPNKEIARIKNLVRWHMFYYPYDKNSLNENESEFKRSPGMWKDSAIRRFVRNVGGEEAVDDLIKLRIADATANPNGMFDPTEIELLQKRISDIKIKDMAMKVTDLDIKGSDLIQMGIEKGPRIGEILNYLLERVTEDPLLNDKNRLMKIVREEMI